MDITTLEMIGKNSFEVSFAAGEFFFPKVVWQHTDGKLQIGMYETEFKLFKAMCIEIAGQGPLEYISHAADSYHFDSTKADKATAQALLAGEMRVSELFEQGHPAATEALAIVYVNVDGTHDQRILPYVRNGRTLRWEESVVEAMLKPRLAGRYIDTMAAAIEASYAGVNENAGG